jgi:hypothetical protein
VISEVNNVSVKRLTAVSFLFFLGMGFGLLLKPSEQSRIPPSNEEIKPATLPKIANDTSIPKLIENQINTGNLTCPNTDILTYETCLLFQGALGIWQRTGMPDICPNVVDDNFESPPQNTESRPKITPRDVLRANKSPCFGYIYSIQVANTIPILISTPNRTFQMASDIRFAEPGSDPLLCMQARYGICGNHAALGIYFLKRAGFDARPLEFYYLQHGQRLSHIIAEVHIDGKWRPIDTTYGAYWATNTPGTPFELIDTDHLIGGNGKGFNQKWNTALLPYGFYSTISRPQYFNYLTSDPDIIRGGSGIVRIKLSDRKEKETLRNKPNYIGDNSTDLKSGGVSFSFINQKPAKYFFRIRVTGSAILNIKESVDLCIDEECLAFSKEKSVYELTVFKPKRLHLKTSMDVAYLILESIEWEAIR